MRTGGKNSHGVCCDMPFKNYTSWWSFISLALAFLLWKLIISLYSYLNTSLAVQKSYRYHIPLLLTHSTVQQYYVSAMQILHPFITLLLQRIMYLCNYIVKLISTVHVMVIFLNLLILCILWQIALWDCEIMKMHVRN